MYFTSTIELVKALKGVFMSVLQKIRRNDGIQTSSVNILIRVLNMTVVLDHELIGTVQLCNLVSNNINIVCTNAIYKCTSILNLISQDIN